MTYLVFTVFAGSNPYGNHIFLSKWGQWPWLLWWAGVKHLFFAPDHLYINLKICPSKFGFGLQIPL